MTKPKFRQLPKGKLPEDYTKTRIWKQLCLQKELGFGDALFGGVMMAWIDKAAAMHLMEKGETKLLRTVNTNTNFINKVKPGDIIDFYGEIVSVGTSSMTIEIDIFKVDVENKNVHPVGSVESTFVRVDDDGESRPIEAGVRKRIKKEIAERSSKPEAIISE
ncbi:MAG: hotdog domain-containing protein [bacterium]|nr:hotdog domain-containing protein [bacterium]